jgi:hypothetical protein
MGHSPYCSIRPVSLLISSNLSHDLAVMRGLTQNASNSDPVYVYLVD